MTLTLDLNPTIKVAYVNIVEYAYADKSEGEEKEALDALKAASSAYNGPTTSDSYKNQAVSLSGSLVDSAVMLDCWVTAMGGQQFGHSVFKNASIKNDNGTLRLTIKLGTGVGVIYGIPFIAYIEPSMENLTGDSVSKPGYYLDDGSHVDAEYTVSSTDFGIRNNLNSSGTMNGTVSKSYAVDSMTFPVSKEKSEYNLWIYINSNMMGVQFCDGSGTSSSNHPNEATPYKATLTIDWDKVTVE